MACAHKENSCQIGVIVGTGTNACYMEKLVRCPKLKNVVDIRDGPEVLQRSLGHYCKHLTLRGLYKNWYLF